MFPSKGRLANNPLEVIELVIDIRYVDMLACEWELGVAINVDSKESIIIPDLVVSDAWIVIKLASSHWFVNGESADAFDVDLIVYHIDIQTL